MEPDLIIKYVNKQYPDFWSLERSINCAVFEALLEPWLNKLSDSDYHRLRNPIKRSPKALLDALAHPQALAAIESALACPGLFACRNEGDVDALMATLVCGSAPRPEAIALDDSLIIPSGHSLEEIPLSAGEAEMAAMVSAFILRQAARQHLACWSDPPAVGASLLAYVVAGRDLCRGAGITAYLAQPFSNACATYLHGSDAGLGEVPFDRALRALARKLGLPEYVSPQALLDKLLETNSILFVLHGDCLQPPIRGRTSAMHRLLMEAKSRTTHRQSKCIPIMLVGTPGDEKIAGRTTRFNEQAGRAIQFGPEASQSRSEFFDRQWRRYCELRGMRLNAEAGSSRLKRVRHYFSTDAGTDAWPATLRLNAFFASNFRTFGYFDPTAGWTRMTGMVVDELPIDVRLHLGEVVNRLRTVDEDRKRWATLRAIRWCSTAVYWLTTEAAQELGRRLIPRTELSTFHAAVENEEGLVEIVHKDEERHVYTAGNEEGHVDTVQDDKERYVYKMGLAARAAIQDRWMRKDPGGRANAHHRIALRLHRSRDDKEMLGVEFPIEPHWGRSRLHFLVECIRHLVRTCDQSPQSDSPTMCPQEGREAFPKPPPANAKGCDPYEVINFCFGQLYWRELNGNGRSKHHTTRKLALQHGAYHLTAELLQLMSDDQRLGRPHWALNEIYVARYLREVGFSQLDLGDLKGAKVTFENLIARARADAQAPLDVIDYQLDLTVVLASMDDLSGAESTLADARAQFESVLASDRHGDARLAQQIQTRIRARQAHLAYLSGSYEESLAHCRHIEENTPAALVRDVAHTYISTLEALGDRRSQELAIKVCVRQLFENTSRGLHHEALGFRVALGHGFRKLELFDAAEAALDGAYEDILEYGCAERTYLSMLLEAGRVLQHQGRFVRAYAAYLRPCLDRAQQRGYARTAQHARTHASECLERLIETVPQEGWSRAQIEAQLEGRGDYLQIRRSKRIDPRYSYEPIALERWLPRLQDRAALAQEMKAIAGPG
jgi:tetratricopeptide (TPR) repeat protein